MKKVPTWLQALAVGVSVLALVASGAWALYLNWQNSTADTAQLNVQKSRAEVEELKTRLAIEAKVELNLKLTALQKKADGEVVVRGDLHFRNTGAKGAYVSVPSGALALYKVSSDHDKNGSERWTRERYLVMRSGHKQTGPPGDGLLGGFFVHAGSENSTSFTFSVKGGGIYAVVFSADLDEQTKRWREKFGGSTGHWHAHDYIQIP